MAIREHPKIGSILTCNFEPGFREPELVKRRPVLVISPKIMNREHLCTVVCLSTTAPKPSLSYHYQINFVPELPDPLESYGVWVKGDMVYTVGFHRLDLIGLGKDISGKRQYYYDTISIADLKKVRGCVLNGLGMQGLTKSL